MLPLGVLLDANNTTTLDPQTTSLLNLLVQILPVLIVMVVLLSVMTSVFGGLGNSPPRRTSKTTVLAATLVGVSLLTLLDVIPVWGAMALGFAAVVLFVVPLSALLPSSGPATLSSVAPSVAPPGIKALEDEGECSKCDAMQVRLTDAERKLEKALDDRGLLAAATLELEALKDGLRILKLKDGSARIVFTTADEEEWYELFDELQEAGKVTDDEAAAQEAPEPVEESKEV